MIWLAVLVLPQASVAVQVRVRVDWPAQEPGVVPSANVRWGFASQASLTEAVAKLGVAGHSIVLGAGGSANTGGVRSTTVVSPVPLVALPQATLVLHLPGLAGRPGPEPGVRAGANARLAARHAA